MLYRTAADNAVFACFRQICYLIAVAQCVYDFIIQYKYRRLRSRYCYSLHYKKFCGDRPVVSTIAADTQFELITQTINYRNCSQHLALLILVL